MYYPGGIDYKEWSRITSNLVVRVTLVLSPPLFGGSALELLTFSRFGVTPQVAE